MGSLWVSFSGEGGKQRRPNIPILVLLTGNPTLLALHDSTVCVSKPGSYHRWTENNSIHVGTKGRCFVKSNDLPWFSQGFAFCMKRLSLRNASGLISLFVIYTTGFEEDILIVSEGKMAPFTHDFRKAQQRMPAIPVNIHSMNFTWQAAGQVSSDKRERAFFGISSLRWWVAITVCGAVTFTVLYQFLSGCQSK